MALSDLIWELSGGTGPNRMRANMTPALMAPMADAVSNHSQPRMRPFSAATPPLESNRPRPPSLQDVMAEEAKRRAISSPLPFDLATSASAAPTVSDTIAQVIRSDLATKADPTPAAIPAPAPSAVPQAGVPAAPIADIGALVAQLAAPARSPWDAVPESQRGYATLGFSPVQAMTGGSHDTGRIASATQFLASNAREQNAADAGRAALINSILANVANPQITAAGHVAAADKAAQGEVASALVTGSNNATVAREKGRADIEVAKQAAQAQAMDAAMKQFPELMKTIFPNGVMGGTQNAAPGTMLGSANQSALVADGKGGVTVVPPAKDAGMVGDAFAAPAAPAAQTPAAVIKTVNGRPYRQVPPGTPGAARADDGNYYVPAA